MPWGRGPGFGFGFGWRAGGRGLGNPYGVCRTFPWLPRRWWAAPGATPFGYPAAGPAWNSWAAAPGTATEAETLKQQAAFLREQLHAIEKRIDELKDE